MNEPPPLDPIRKWKGIAIFMAIYAATCFIIPGLLEIACGTVPTALLFWAVYSQLMAMDNFPTKGMPFRQCDVIHFFVALIGIGVFILLTLFKEGGDTGISMIALAIIGLIIFVKAGGDLRQG